MSIMGSLRHSSIQGMPPCVAMTPDIEQKLIRMRSVSSSPDSAGIMNKVHIIKQIQCYEISFSCNKVQLSWLSLRYSLQHSVPVVEIFSIDSN